MSKPIIGLEIHGYLETKEKLFCTCPNYHDMKIIKPNINACATCSGQPGSKPMLPNKSAIDKILEIALILNCKINVVPKSLLFQRKHYDWPDMPHGYQKTVSGAYSDFVAKDGNFLGIRIREIHLEEDPAAWDPQTGVIDYNRAGVPLVEIVTEPDFHSGEQVQAWLKQLILTLSYVYALNKDSGIKADVNISIPKLSVRTEMKNIGSTKEIINAIKYEEQRHLNEKPKVQETRRWNSVKGKTELMRSKEEAADYRFIPDPDLPLIKITKQRVEDIKKSIPETPQEKLDKIIKKFKIDKKDAEVLIQNIDIAEIFEEIIKKVDAGFVLPWITVELFSVLNYNNKTLDEVDIKAEHIIELLNLVKSGKLTPLKGKDILRKFVPKSFSPLREAKAHVMISNKDELKDIIKKVIKDNGKSVESYKSGNSQVLNFLIGQVMHLTNKRADYKTVREIFEKELN